MKEKETNPLLLESWFQGPWCQNDCGSSLQSQTKWTWSTENFLSESVFFSHKPGSSEHLSISFYIFSWCIFINSTDVMERKYRKFSLDVVQFHAGCCTGDRSFISVPFIGAVGFWWEADSHSDKVALSNYLAILALKLDATSEQGTSLKLIYCWLY